MNLNKKRRVTYKICEHLWTFEPPCYQKNMKPGGCIWRKNISIFSYLFKYLIYWPNILALIFLFTFSPIINRYEIFLLFGCPTTNFGQLLTASHPMFTTMLFSLDRGLLRALWWGCVAKATKHQVGFEPGNFLILSHCLNPINWAQTLKLIILLPNKKLVTT